MKLIYLTNGGITIVDDDIYLWASKEKWYHDDKGYIRNTKSGRLLHRLIMNTPKAMYTDHENHFNWDNGRKNLRVCTSQRNLWNQKVSNTFKEKAKVSKYKGVGRNGNRWGARIVVDRKQIHLGTFDLQSDAALAYNKAATLYFGEFACLNPIEEGCPQCS